MGTGGVVKISLRSVTSAGGVVGKVGTFVSVAIGSHDLTWRKSGDKG